VLNYSFDAVLTHKSIVVFKFMQLPQKIFVAQNLFWRSSHGPVIGVSKPVLYKIKMLFHLLLLLLSSIKVES
jgi:hypothetical protein